VTNLNSGVYCVNEGDFIVNGGDTLIGDDVVIVVRTGDITINGGGNVQLTAPTEGTFKGLLLFTPESNVGSVTINGDSTVNITGTMLVPACDVKLNGSGSTFSLSSQVIGFTVDISGTATTNIHYDDNSNYDSPVPPQVELVQ
jgi:hypothetical protein